jgi:hypothetical protein
MPGITVLGTASTVDYAEHGNDDAKKPLTGYSNAEHREFQRLV